MHVFPGPWLLALLNGVLLLVVLGVASYVLIWRSAGVDDGGKAWRGKTRQLAQEIQQTADVEETPADPDRVARRLLPLAGRIQGHVRAAPASANEGIYRRLFELGMACQRVATEHRPQSALSDDVFLEDRLQELREDAVALERTVEPD